MNRLDQAAMADRIEARAWCDFYDAAPPDLRSAFGISRAEAAGATLLHAPGFETGLFNRAIGLGMGQAQAGPDDISEITAAFMASGALDWWLHVNSHAKPADLADSMRARGWKAAPIPSWTKMLRAAGASVSAESELGVKEASNSSAASIAGAITEGFGLPEAFGLWLTALHNRVGWRLFGVFEGARPVGGGALFIDGPSAWIGMGSVIASHRRRGGQRALICRRLNEANHAGAHWTATETGDVKESVNPSYLNMRHFGFEQVASRLNLTAPKT